jgi:hypothetical protein
MAELAGVVFAALALFLVAGAAGLVAAVIVGSALLVARLAFRSSP